MKWHWLELVGSYIYKYRVRSGIFLAVGVGVVMILVQLAYPWDKLPLYSEIDTIAVGGKSIDQATNELNKQYSDLPLQLYFGDGDRPYRQPTLADVGLKINSANQVKENKYTWWQRLIPTSLWWAHFLNTNVTEPIYQNDFEKTAKYIEKEFGKECTIKSRNATIKYSDNRLIVVSATDGGTCKTKEVQQLLKNAKPRIFDAEIKMSIKPEPAVITDVDAGKFASKLEDRTATGLTIAVFGNAVTVDQSTLLSWLDFEAPDTGLLANINKQRANKFFANRITQKVEKPPGTSYVTTLDFSIISQRTGISGQELNVDATIKAIEDWLIGSKDVVSAQISAVAPNVIYTRKYSATDTGITALITQFAKSHSGSFGVSFIELDGQKRRAVYNDKKLFRTASTYKLFVAYSALKRIESGKWKWSDQIHGGRNLAKCFDDMIVRSDNECAEQMLYKIGFQEITDEINSIGLSNSSFVNENIETTAGDLTTFVGALHAGQLLSKNSTNTLLSAMERNIFRQGIPAGAKGTVADKVGFLEDYLNDSAIVYGSKGTYALTIMTKGSSWGTIAELTRQIEALRIK